jgi:hypothetical protein
VTDRDKGPPRVLVVAIADVPRERLRDELSRAGDDTPEVRVVSPAVVDSGIKHEFGDIDAAIEPAERRLREALQGLEEVGIEAEGSVADADPILAINDQLQTFRADRILLVSHRDDEAVYAENGLLERANRDFEQPIVELQVERDGEGPHVAERHETPPGIEEGGGRSISANLPPLTGRDTAGILVGVLGTLLLGILAADCAIGHEGSIEGGCAVRILIAGGALLINLAHGVALFLFESVRYRGLWERVFSRLTLIGTPVAVLVSLLVG